jgi:putative phosphoribosyl transferase
MKGVFGNRAEAGRLLAEAFVHYAGRDEVLALGLPHGVPVAFEVARRLQVPLDVFVFRKLGVPSHEEYAFGVIAIGGVRVVDEDVVEELHIPGDVIGVIVAREERELRRRELAYPGHDIPLQIRKLASVPSHGRAPPESSGRPPVRAAGRLMPAMHFSNGRS